MIGQNLFALLLILDLFCGAYGIGRLLLRALRVHPGTGERIVFGATLGMGVLGYGIEALGLLRLFRPPVFIALLILCLGGAPFLLRDLGDAARNRKSVTARDPIVLLCTVVLGLLAIGTLIAALGPPVGLAWDALSYHLGAPKTYLRAGRVFYIPYDHHSNFPFTLEMLFALMLGVGSVGGATLCHWLCGALLTASVVTFACRYGADNPRRAVRTGMVAAVLLASTPMVLWEASVAYADLAVALFVFLSLYSLLNAAQATEEPTRGASVPHLVLSAILMGFGLGNKYTVLAFWGLLLAAIFGWHWVTTRKWAKETIPHAALWGGIALLVGSPWYIKNILSTGNPVYPFYYGLLGGRYWNAENAAQYVRDQATLGLPKTPVNLLLDPWQATMLPDSIPFTEYFTFALSPLFVGLGLALLLLGRRLPRPYLYLLLFAIGLYGFWFATVQQTRYLLPALPALALVGAWVLEELAVSARLARLAGTGLATLAALWGIYIAGGLAFWGVALFDGHSAASPAWPVVSGQVPREEYIARHTIGFGAAELWINANTPPDAKVALFDEPRGFYLDRDYIWAQPNHAAGLLPWDTYREVDDWLADFKKRGYTTFLVGEHNPDAPSDGQRWRSLLEDAVRGDKVTLVHEEPASAALIHVEGQEQPVRVRLTVKVYRIP